MHSKISWIVANRNFLWNGCILYDPWKKISYTSHWYNASFYFSLSLFVKVFLLVYLRHVHVFLPIHDDSGQHFVVHDLAKSTPNIRFHTLFFCAWQFAPLIMPRPYNYCSATFICNIVIFNNLSLTIIRNTKSFKLVFVDIAFWTYIHSVVS